MATVVRELRWQRSCGLQPQTPVTQGSCLKRKNQPCKFCGPRACCSQRLGSGGGCDPGCSLPGGWEGTGGDGRGSGALHWPKCPQGWAGRSLQELKFHSRARIPSFLCLVGTHSPRTGSDASPPPVSISIESAVSTREPGRPEVLPGRRDLAIWLPGIPRASQGAASTWVFTEHVFPRETEPPRQVSTLRPSLLMLVSPPGVALGGCWGASASLPERPLPGLSAPGKVFQQAPVHQPPDDHPPPAGLRPARNAPLSPCAHARHTHVCTRRTLAQAAPHTRARAPPTSSPVLFAERSSPAGASSHLTAPLNYFRPRWGSVAALGLLTAGLLSPRSAGSGVQPQ